MKSLSKPWMIAAVLIAAACSKDVEITGAGGAGAAQLQVINASATPINLVVDGQIVIQGIAGRSLSSSIGVDAGSRSVEFRSQSGSTLAQLTVAASSGKVVTLASMPSGSNGVSAAVVGDTGATVSAGFGKLRVLHLAASAPTLEIWRTQPDFQTPIRFAFPFTYGNNSGFDQSTPGNWEVRVWRPATDSTNLAHWANPDAQLTIAVPSGVVKTVAVLDAATGTGFQIQVVP
jgi:hypothetical protein